MDTEAKRVRIILGCGANIGVETLRFRLYHPHAEIIAVEADPSNFTLLAENCRDSSRISPVHAAVWSKDAEPYLHRSLGGNPESSAVGELVSECTVPGYSIECLRTLRGWPEIDILKLNIESAEFELFFVNTTWLEKVNCLVFAAPDSDRPGTLQLIFENWIRRNGTEWLSVRIWCFCGTTFHGL